LRPDKLAERVRHGLALHRAGDLRGAEPLYAAVLRSDSRHFGALHLLGLLRAQAGDPAGAVKLLRRAIAVEGGHGFVHNNLGNALVELGAPEEALAAFDRAVALDPKLMEAWVGRGNALHAMGRFAEALVAHDAAIAAGAEMAEAHGNRGNALRALGRIEEALAAYDAAIARSPTYATAHANRATALSDAGRDAEALASIGIALALRSDHAGTLESQGIILRLLGRPVEALASLDRALALAPGSVGIQASRAAALSDLGRHEEALSCADAALGTEPASVEARRNRAVVLSRLGRHAESEVEGVAALALAPDCAEALNSRGNALIELGRFEEALECFGQAGTLRPDNPKIPYNRGNALRGMGRHAEAVDAFRTATAMDPGFVEPRWNASLSLLATGDFTAGLPAYEARWQRRNHPRPRHAAAPLWRGEDIAGRTLLLHAEQGLGDTIQMARYASLAAGRSARVVLEAQRPLLPLLHGLPGVAELVAMGDPVPPHDAQCPLMSLPLAFGTDANSIPGGSPYLAADPARVAEWDRLLPQEGLRLGIVCSGNADHAGDRHRSVPLAAFAPLLGPGVRGFLLQTEIRPADEAALREMPGLTALRQRLTDFGETAAALSAIDLLVSVDTSVAHLGGALGRPVWMLLPPLPDWRWMLDRKDSPWYPGMRLFRRARDEAWSQVVARIAAAMPAGSDRPAPDSPECAGPFFERRGSAVFA
jgi:tetratricopeptide (TPR) repeat protein